MYYYFPHYSCFALDDISDITMTFISDGFTINSEQYNRIFSQLLMKYASKTLKKAALQLVTLSRCLILLLLHIVRFNAWRVV